MKIYKFFLIFLLSSFLLANKEIENIREIYSEVKKMETYQSTLNVNSNNLSAPAVGTYNVFTTFYWTWDGGEPFKLRRVFERISRSNIKEESEYLFDEDEKLLFFYEKGGYDDIEERYYFKNSKLIRYINKKKIYDKISKEQKSKGDDILKRAKRKIALFRLTE